MPLTSKGARILDAMQSRYGTKRGKSVFYASINSGKLRGVESKADGGPVDRLPEHYAEIGGPRIEDRRENDQTLRAMGLAALKARATGKHARTRMASDMGSAEIVDMMVPRGYADGGVMDSPYANMMPKSPDSGFIPGTAGGRSDTKPKTVEKGAYVLPSDLVSAVGDGNSIAGAAKLGKMFNLGPGGTRIPKIKGRPLRTTKIIRQRFQDGGMMEGDTADIMASDGEVILPPSALIEKFGDLDLAHEALDQFVLQMRKQNVKKLSKLPGPKR